MNIQQIQPQTRTTVSHHTDSKIQMQEPSHVTVQKPENIQHHKPQSEDSLIGTEERKFFEELFPHATQEVRAYHAYRRDGTRVAFTTGTFIDRKG